MVIAVIMILASLLVIGMGQVFSSSQSLKCQHRLSQLGYACQLFAGKHGGSWPKSWNNVVTLDNGSVARQRWYDVLATYCGGDKGVFGCPMVESATEGEEASDTFAGTGRILYYNLGLGRDSGGWGSWSTYAASRDWLINSDRTPTNPNNIPYEVDYAGGNTEEAWISSELLDTYDQIWILATITYPVGFHESEFDALNAFHQAGGGIHVFAESHPVNQWINCPNALSNELDYGITCSVGGLSGGLMNFDPDSTHPVMAGVSRHATNDTPALLHLSNGAFAIGVDPSFGTLIAGWDGGLGRVIVHSSFTTMYSTHWTNSGDDVKIYCNNAAEWLFGGSSATGTCSYGYNDNLSKDGSTPAASTVCIMDYAQWRIRRGSGDASDDPDGYIAIRHSARANVLFADGAVRSLYLEEFLPRMWTPSQDN